MNYDKRLLDEENKWLTNVELGMKLGLHPKIIRDWRKKLNLECKIKGDTSDFRQDYKMPKVKYEQILDPKIWDTREFFEEYYIKRNLPIIRISRIIGRHRDVVRNRVKKYGLTRPPYDPSSKHPCCNEDWLYDHYINQKLGINTCAKKAGVNSYTIYNWLAKFNIEVRSVAEGLAIASERRLKVKRPKYKNKKRHRFGYSNQRKKSL